MRAMILAGGKSTRLYPLTLRVPKPLVPVAGEPIASLVMRYLASYGIGDVAINVHYHGQAVEDRFGDGSDYGVRLSYLREPVLLGSAGAVKQMSAFFDGTFVVIGCDDLTDAPLDDLIAFHRRSGAVATIGLVHADDVSQYGAVVVDARGKILEFQEKPPKGTERSNLVNTGIYIFEPAILERIPPDEFYDFGKQVFGELLRDGQAFYGLELDGAYWCDIGTVPEYRRATADVLDGRVRLPGGDPVFGVAADTLVGDGATIEGRLCVGRGVAIGRGARVCGPGVLGNGVRVGAGTVVERSILWDGVVVDDGARVRDCIVGLDYRVAAGAVLEGAVAAVEEDDAAVS